MPLLALASFVGCSDSHDYLECFYDLGILSGLCNDGVDGAGHDVHDGAIAFTREQRYRA